MSLSFRAVRGLAVLVPALESLGCIVALESPAMMTVCVWYTCYNSSMISSSSSMSSTEVSVIAAGVAVDPRYNGAGAFNLVDCGCYVTSSGGFPLAVINDGVAVVRVDNDPSMCLLVKRVHGGPQVVL